MHYYKILNDAGNVTQLDATDRIIRTEHCDFIVEITKEEYEQISLEIEQQRTI